MEMVMISGQFPLFFPISDKWRFDFYVEVIVVIHLTRLEGCGRFSSEKTGFGNGIRMYIYGILNGYFMVF